MKILLMSLMLTAATSVFAHDEGHGPKLTESGKYGGVLASMIEEKDIDQGAKSQRVYKAELVKSEDNEISVYIYDEKMNLVPMTKFKKEGRGSLEIFKNNKPVIQDFKLSTTSNHFQGKAPRPEKRPFNIDVRVEEGNRKLFVAFDNLD
jgi:hypothetical protein